jgi:phage tail-like protein
MVEALYRTYNYKLIFQPDIAEAHFTEVSGLGIKVNTIAYREGGAQAIVHKLPGFVEYADVTLRYGLSSSRELWDWFLTGVNGKVERRNVSIVLLHGDGVTELMRWDLLNAWVTEWRGAVLDAMTNEVAIETMTLTFDTMQRS